MAVGIREMSHCNNVCNKNIINNNYDIKYYQYL